MIKSYRIVFLSLMFFSPFIKSSLSSVVVQYEQALQDFIKSHKELNPTKPIALTQSNIIFSTYSKIIAPYISYISGYGRIVGQEFARSFPYHADLLTMSDEFFKYDKEVKRIALFFPKDQQSGVIDCFYEQLTSTVVQVCYQIIKEVSYALSSNSDDLASVYIAYNLAWAAQTKNMKLTGLAQGQDFKESVTKLMITLYQAAVLKKTHSLEFYVDDTAKRIILSKEINAYQEILYHVYTNAGQKDLADKQLLAIKGFKQKLTVLENEAKSLGVAKKLPTAAQVLAQSGQASAVDPSSIPALKSQAVQAFSSGQAAEKLGNFADSMAQYALAQTAYLKLLSAPSLAADENSNKAQYFLAKTRWTASSLASTVIPIGNSTFQGLDNVAASYVVNVYEPQINATLFSSAMPSSLSLLPIGKLSSALTIEQKKDILQLFKAFLVSQVLSGQSTSFSDCFTDYNLTLKPQVSSLNKSIVVQALSTVNDYMQSFTQDIVSSVEMTSSTTMTALFVKMPIPAVTPLYSSGLCAIDYFLGARSLFEKGTALISLYGSTYVPGDDPVGSNAMIENMACAYSSAAQSKIDQAKKIMKEVLSFINVKKSSKSPSIKSPVLSDKAASSASEKQLPANFATLYEEFKKAIIQSQSLLVAQDQSAQAYFLKAGLAQQAKIAEQIYISLYKLSIDFAKQCLVGDPTSTAYNNLLFDINSSYLQWASELDPTLDSVQIANINQDIVNLFVVGGEQCLKFSSQEPMFPGFNQVHYYSAAQRFLASQKQYTSMKNTKMAAEIQDKVTHAYFLACNQSVELYFYVKSNGLSYESSSTNQLTKISFAQICKDYASFEQLGTDIDSGEMHAFNSVQNLLFVSSMLLSGLSPSAGPSAAKTNVAKSVATTPSQKVLNYLIKNNILEKGTGAVPYMQVGIKEKIIKIAPAAYINFKSDGDSLSALFAILTGVIQNLYMQDYLGATASESSALLTTQTKEFFDAVQKETSSLENPSSAYIA
ncbi:MAG: hypothetical protein NTU89_00710 [Candidatus Dependentiae bacterium]|nr:hypothetical protein [Candidatus Dependentiae bacterium]